VKPSTRPMMIALMARTISMVFLCCGSELWEVHARGQSLP
jgi:hypothetical protein